ncbi:iron-containing alcohol dehydrogenase [Sutterella sp.]|uniref:iron-containing alcohol dehydrogenase n=1 Tax=Sutterella sp. TaxID=1981025 RepID=UPI0026DECBB0|nr:iron-containing alcohol dehydrogenase [Sutterella sp.]MDO5531190.1 iron-containing alcohol dehydrogenase [Sutterella sp.]
MLNFSYQNSTRLVFGRDAELSVGKTALDVLGAPGKVLVIYGGGSAVRTGILGAVEKSLEEAGFTVLDKGGVQPNPRMGFIRETIDWIRDQGVKAVVAVGGGSVIDTAKAVAMGLEYEGDCWDFFEGKAKPVKAAPVFAVLTIPAAGSEQSIRCVITHHGTKAGIGVECIRPKAAFINPERFFTLPPVQVSAGVLDMFSHILERYFSNTTNTAYTDGQAEAALRTIIEFGPKVLADVKDYDSWCQIGLAGSYAHNGYFGLGREEDWACHAIEHEISGWNENITHGCGLAVVIPAWMRYVSKFAPARFVTFAVNVMGVAPQADEKATIELGIAKFVGWIQALKLPTTLEALGAADCPIESLAHHCCRNGTVGHLKALDADDVEAILTGAR